MSRNTLQIIFDAKDEVSAKVKTIENKLNNMKDNLSQVATASSIGFGAFALGIKKSTDLASDLEESINAVNVVFKNGASEVLNFSKMAVEKIGLTTAEFNQMAAVTGALFKGTGMSMEEVAKQTNELSVRAADMASVFNTDVKDAMSAINQALRGETEAIRRYASDVTDASLQQFLLSQGINKSVTEMSQQEKVMLRLQKIMADTQVTAGDYANTQDSLANLYRNATASLQEMMAVIGNTLIPTMKSLVSRFDSVVDSVKRFVEENPQLVKAIALTTTTGLALVAGLSAIGLAIITMTPAVMKLTGVVTGLMTAFNVGIFPLTIAVGVISVAVIQLKNLAQAVFRLGGGNAMRDFADGMLIAGERAGSLASRIKDLATGTDGFSDSIKASMGNIKTFEMELDEIGAKVEKVNDKIAKAVADSNKRQQQYGMDTANAFLDQEEKVQKLKEEIAEKTKSMRKADSSDVRANLREDLEELKASLIKEQEALQNASNFKIGLEDQLLEAKRFRNLTDFEQTLETLQKKKEEEKKALAERMADLEKEKSAVFAQQEAIRQKIADEKERIVSLEKGKQKEIMKLRFLAEAQQLAMMQRRAVLEGDDEAAEDIYQAIRSLRRESEKAMNQIDLMGAGDTRNVAGQSVTINITGNTLLDDNAGKKITDSVIEQLNLQTRGAV